MKLAPEGRLEEARERFEQVRNRAQDEDLKRIADRSGRQLDAEIQLRRAHELMRNNHLREAEVALSAADTLWLDDDYRSRAASALADVRGRRQIEVALAEVKSGRLAEAHAAFARVVAMDVPEAMKDYARRNMKELDAAMRGR